MSILSNLDFSIVPQSLPFIGKGLLFSLQLTVIAMIGGVIIGTILAVARLSAEKIKPLSAMARATIVGILAVLALASDGWLMSHAYFWIPVTITIVLVALAALVWFIPLGLLLEHSAKLYVDLMRSIPLLMMILWFFLLAPYVIDITPETSALITFTLFQAAFYSEIMRAGIQSISRGQINASLALGMTYSQMMWNIVLPQAFRNMVPVLLTQTFILFQDTSLVWAIGATDLLKAADNAGKIFSRTIEMYIFVSLIYFVICFSLSMFVKYMNKRIAIIR